MYVLCTTCARWVSERGGGVLVEFQIEVMSIVDETSRSCAASWWWWWLRLRFARLILCRS